MDGEKNYTAFVGEKMVASGPLKTLLPRLKVRFEQDQGTLFLIFDDHTGKQVDFDLRGPVKDVIARALPGAAHPGPGRPKLGVMAREVTLLPSHWEWLEEQPNGASAALRRLVDRASKEKAGHQRARQAAAGRFLTAMAGNLPDYEEATRALYAGNRKDFDHLIRNWPKDIRVHTQRVVADVF